VRGWKSFLLRAQFFLAARRYSNHSEANSLYSLEDQNATAKVARIGKKQDITEDRADVSGFAT